MALEEQLNSQPADEVDFEAIRLELHEMGEELEDHLLYRYFSKPFNMLSIWFFLTMFLCFQKFYRNVQDFCHTHFCIIYRRKLFTKAYIDRI